MDFGSGSTGWCAGILRDDTTSFRGIILSLRVTEKLLFRIWAFEKPWSGVAGRGLERAKDQLQ
ncbi:MAG: hypothetical protein PHO82_10935, partial [Mesotoga sp.]|uniref:hypothetical protein n=1 Tax=Mesotoga sp. TaxID=2053577 RepID=UPI002608AC2F